MESLTIFAGVIIIIFGILQIILFFKLWGMTNNIAKMAQKSIPHTAIEWHIRSEILKGNKDNVNSFLVDSFVKDLEKICNTNAIPVFYVEEIEKLKTTYKNYYTQIGIQFPKALERIETKEDVVGLFEL